MKESLKARKAKKILKKVLICVMSFGIALGATGCFSNCNVTPPEKDPPVVTPVDPPVETPEDPPVVTPEDPPIVTPEDPPITIQERMAQFDETRQSAVQGKNFTVSIVSGGETQNWLVSGDKVSIENGTKIYSKEEDDAYWYTLEDATWVREETEEANPSQSMIDLFSGLQLEVYYEQSNSFEGIYQNNAYITYRTDDGFVLSNAQNSYTVTEIGKTSVSTPSQWVEKQDEVDPPEIIDPVDPPVVDTDKLVLDNGTYNLSLMKDLVWNWIKNDNQFGKDVMTFRSRNDAISTEKLLYVNPASTGLNIGFTYSNETNGNLYYSHMTLPESVNLTSREAFVNSLNALERGDIEGTDSVQIDTTVSDEDVATRTANIMKQLGKEDENVVAVCESVKTSFSLTYGHGIAYKTLIVLNDEILDIEVDALTKDDVTQNTEKWNAQVLKTEQITIRGVEGISVEMTK